MTYVKVIKWANGTRQLRITRPDQKPEDIEISHYDALMIASDLLSSIQYKVIKND